MKNTERVSILISPTIYNKLRSMANKNMSRNSNRGSISRQIRKILEEYFNET